MRVVGTNQKQFKCDACGGTSEPISAIAHVPEGWLRIQKKGDYTAYYSGRSWQTLACVCDKCAKKVNLSYLLGKETVNA